MNGEGVRLTTLLICEDSISVGGMNGISVSDIRGIMTGERPK
jgi:hypothetical protein